MEDSTSILDLPNKNSGMTQMPDIDTAIAAAATVDPKYMNKVITGIQQSGGATLGSLPSRDIPMNTLEIQTDEHTRANYVPAAPVNIRDYVNDYEEKRPSRSEAAKSAAVKKEKAMSVEDLYIPFIVSLLYFIFNMPALMQFSFKYFKFLHQSDGNISGVGLFFKAAAFGVLVYMIQRGVSLL